MARVGFVGLGVMGSEMVLRLMEKGHLVTGYNRTKSKAQRLIDKGMKWADSPRAVAAASEYTLSMVTNTAALHDIAEGPNGVLAGLAGGKLWADMSTVAPAINRDLAEKARAKNSDLVDAPVSGSVITLQQGKLSIFVGGKPETFEKLKPLLLDIGPKVTLVGENGLALVMKIATNLSLAVQMLAFSEGVLLAEKSGIKREIAVDVMTHSVIGSPMVQMLAFSEGVLLAEKSGIKRETAVDVMTHSVIGSPMVQYRGPFVLKQPEEAWFDVNMMQKDMLLALELGRQVDVPLPTTAATNELLTAARGMGLAKKDFAILFDVLARMAGVTTGANG